MVAQPSVPDLRVQAIETKAGDDARLALAGGMDGWPRMSFDVKSWEEEGEVQPKRAVYLLGLCMSPHLSPYRPGVPPAVVAAYPS